MIDQYFSPHSTGADLEKEVLTRFRHSVPTLGRECKIFREPWDSYTIICLDFESCPQNLDTTQQQVNLLMEATEKLGLARAIVFKNGKKVIGWLNLN